MRESYDAIVVGAGHNGLVCSAYLAKAGLDVLVLERRGVVGGACVTEEFYPGFKVSTAAYAVSLLRPKIIKELELGRYGLKLHAKDPQYFTPFPDGEHIFLWRETRRSCKEIERFSNRDAKAYEEFEVFWKKFGLLMEPLLMMPPMPLKEMLSLIGPKDEEVVRTVLFSSVKDFLDEFFESEYVKAALATQGIIGVWGGPYTPGTLFIMAHHAVGEVNGERGVWGYAEGGMGSITKALASSAEGFGATIALNKEVDRIMVKDGKALGVQLKDGKRIASRLVVSNADPKRTLLGLVGRENLDKDVARRLERLKSRGVAMKVNCALSELPRFKVKRSWELGPEAYCTIGICPSIDYLERAWDDCKYGYPSKEPFMEAIVQSTTDPTLAPAGKHSLSIYAQYAPYNLKEDRWDEIREEVGLRVIDTLSQYAPNLRKSVIHMQVLTPLDLEREFYLTNGCIFHIDMSLDQLFTNRPVSNWGHRTSIDGLYLCGSGTHPGGGVMGSPGYLAAKAVLKDLGLIG